MKSDYIENDSFEVLLSIMQYENALALRVSLETGLRIGDVLSLRPVDIDTDFFVHTKASKTGKPVARPLTVRTYDALKRNSGRLWCFPSPRNYKRHRTRQAVWHDVKRCCERCGVRLNVTPHSARKIYAVKEFREKGLEAVRNDLQHENLTTTMLYAFSDLLTKEKNDKKGEKTQDIVDNNPKNPNFILCLVEKFCQNLGGVEKVSTALSSALNYFFRDDDKGRAGGD